MTSDPNNSVGRCELRLLVVALALAGSASLAAQEPTTEAPNLPLHLGPLTLAPQVRLSTLYDSNVYNLNTDPKEDWVTSAVPQTRVFAKLGRMMVDGRAEGSAEYYRLYTDQNAINMVGSVTLAVPLGRFTPHATYSALSSRERFGFEIDDRPRRHEQGIAGGLDLRVASKTVLAFKAQRERERFGEDTVFRGENLPQALNREMRLIGVTLRHALSVLTTLSISVDQTEDRFEFLRDRDARGTSVSGGLAFKPTALVTGAFTVGYLRFAPVERSTSEFNGIVMSGDLGYVLRGVTRFGVQTQRNVTYSYDPSTPYYVLTGFDASVSHRAGERWAISGRAGRHRLNYVSAAIVATSIGTQPDASTDTSELVGMGLGYQLSRDTQIGVEVDRLRRFSEQPIRQFESTRVRTTLGFRF
jgi:hypothetical protein